MTHTDTQPTTDQADLTSDRPRLPVWQATALAVGAAVLTWAIESPLAGIDLTVHSNGVTRVVGVISVAVSTVFITLAAAFVARVIRNRTARPRRAWLLTGTMVCVLSLAGPLGQAATAAGMAALTLLHVVVAIAVVAPFARALPASRGA